LDNLGRVHQLQVVEDHEARVRLAVLAHPDLLDDPPAHEAQGLRERPARDGLEVVRDPVQLRGRPPHAVDLARVLAELAGLDFRHVHLGQVAEEAGPVVLPRELRVAVPDRDALGGHEPRHVDAELALADLHAGADDRDGLLAQPAADGAVPVRVARVQAHLGDRVVDEVLDVGRQPLANRPAGVGPRQAGDEVEHRVLGHRQDGLEGLVPRQVPEAVARLEQLLPQLPGDRQLLHLRRELPHVGPLDVDRHHGPQVLQLLGVAEELAEAQGGRRRQDARHVGHRGGVVLEEVLQAAPDDLVGVERELARPDQVGHVGVGVGAVAEDAREDGPLGGGVGEFLQTPSPS
jgi:hypothetical protein